MLKTRIIPTLLMREVNLVKGPAFDSWRAVGAPMQSIKVFNRRDVDELVLLDIAATPAGRGPDIDMVATLAQECFVPLTVGGGITKLDEIRQLLLAGADKVSINSGAYSDPGLITAASDAYGAQCIVAAIDYRTHEDGRRECFAKGGSEATGRDVIDWARELERLGAGEIQLTSIERDSLMEGYDLKTIAEIATAVSIPIIASGG
ncbi:MAG TPA: imidazole glycerol phosphate synthase cyclase subunit, partial [Sphingorhabdus sp.]|nr:imidazole glycerol phosphate synthase cyclase subunit [Sphingorhabdus sp.]